MILVINTHKNKYGGGNTQWRSCSNYTIPQKTPFIILVTCTLRWCTKYKNVHHPNIASISKTDKVGIINGYSESIWYNIQSWILTAAGKWPEGIACQLLQQGSFDSFSYVFFLLFFFFYKYWSFFISTWSISDYSTHMAHSVNLRLLGVPHLNRTIKMGVKLGTKTKKGNNCSHDLFKKLSLDFEVYDMNFGLWLLTELRIEEHEESVITCLPNVHGKWATCTAGMETVHNLWLQIRYATTEIS